MCDEWWVCYLATLIVNSVIGFSSWMYLGNIKADHTNWWFSGIMVHFLSFSVIQTFHNHVNFRFIDFDLELRLLTGELYRKSLLADEIIWIKLQCEYVESRVNVFRQGWAWPLFQQDPPVWRPRWTIPNSQNIVADLSVKDNEVEAEKTQ